MNPPRGFSSFFNDSRRFQLGHSRRMPAPDEASALAAVKAVQSLSGPDFEKRVRTEVGDPLLAMFSLLAKNVAPSDDDRAIAEKVQLMLLSYLVREELGKAPATGGRKK
jgi:hypothetical protein